MTSLAQGRGRVDRRPQPVTTRACEAKEHGECRLEGETRNASFLDTREQRQYMVGGLTKSSLRLIRDRNEHT